MKENPPNAHSAGTRPQLDELIFRDLQAAAGTPEEVASLKRFFKTAPGQYAENDRFLGIRVPAVRAIAKKYAAASAERVPATTASSLPPPLRKALEKLLAAPWHEARLCALLILVLRFQKLPAGTPARLEIFEFYLSHASRACTNWDLVDLTAPKIVGEYLAKDVPATKSAPSQEERKRILFALAESENLWEARIALVSTLALIQRSDFSMTFALAKKLCAHPHDLIHKATGWMLREVGRRDRGALLAFLKNYAARLPRTSLRVALEHFPKSSPEREKFLGRKNR